jgi:hypothetical protein
MTLEPRYDATQGAVDYGPGFRSSHSVGAIGTDLAPYVYSAGDVGA